MVAAAANLGRGTDTTERVVLVVEDEILIRLDLADALRQRGLRVIEAANADQAIEVLTSTARIDLVVADIRMPGGRDGLDVARTVRALRPGLRIIITSGDFRPAEEHRPLVDLVVSKPVRTDQLATTIVKLINPDADG